jgi:MFS family permease
VGVGDRAGAGRLALAGALTAGAAAADLPNGIGLAMRWPVFAAIVPQVVSRAVLPQALALNGISMNLSRVVGPVLAGALLAAWSPAAVFVLNALLAGVAFVLILRWKLRAAHQRAAGRALRGRHAHRPQHVRCSRRAAGGDAAHLPVLPAGHGADGAAAAGGARLHGGGPAPSR